MEKRAIAFSLWGDRYKYTEGMLKNVHLAAEHYPGWTVDIWYDGSVSKKVLKTLKDFPNVELREGDRCIVPVNWRFLSECYNDVTIFRDADSRITQREAAAVNEWVSSGSILHIMRDHPHHGYPMLGGMWGIRREFIDLFKEIVTWQSKRGIKVTEELTFYDKSSWGMVDMDFLRDVVYPKFGGNVLTSMVHQAKDFDSSGWVFRPEGFAKDFPDPLDKDKHFVGEIFEFLPTGAEVRMNQYLER
jgi:protein O-GlcNAc transferase